MRKFNKNKANLHIVADFALFLLSIKFDKI